MKAILGALILTTAALAATRSLGDDVPPESLDRGEGSPVGGRIVGDAGAGFGFQPADGSAVVRLQPGMVVRGPGRGTDPSAGPLPFHAEVGRGQRISGRLARLDGRELTLLDANGAGKIVVARSGLRALVQRAGEALVAQDGFEELDTRRWKIIGEPKLDATPHMEGARALRLEAMETSLTYSVPEPFGAGRLELAFHDDAVASADAGRAFVDVGTRVASGMEWLRVVLGWNEESLAVETRGSTALAVQRLARGRGWHRLEVRFGKDRCEVSVDGAELAHGKALGGAIAEIRIGAAAAPKATTTPPTPVMHFDDFRLVRSTEPVGDLEVDARQDELRLSGGDQVFGKVNAADPSLTRSTIDDQEVVLPWSEVSGIYFRREAGPGAVVSGLLARVEWRASPGQDPRDIDGVEGALAGLSETTLELATPYAGTLAIPRASLVALRVLGRGSRLVVDNAAHHLGDSIATMPPLLDPPQPEGGVFERAFEVPANLEGTASLSVDVVQLVGEAADLPFSALIRKGELRTNLALNGAPFDYLNHYMTTRNESPERLRIPLPRKLLRPGRNVIRFEQVGIASDPNYLDDFGLLELAIEFGPARRAGR